MIFLKILAWRNRHTASLAKGKRTLSGNCINTLLEGLDGDISDETVMKSFDTLVGKTTRAAIADDRQIKQMISKIVPAKTMKHIEFCRVEGGRVRITVDSAAWISRIRFLETQIIDALRERRFDTHTVSYHVSPELRQAELKPAPRAIKTTTGAAAVEAAVTTLINNGEEANASDRLRLELLKLAKALRGEKN